MSKKTPLVSIVSATYNRSNALFYSLSSLLQSDYSNWECLAVGDGCTDDTRHVVSGFNEKRISFVNLDRNYGEQTFPNNYGCLKARGKYIAFLNHDDLWFPDHLSTLVSSIEKTGADMVYGLAAIVMPDQEVKITGISGRSVFEPTTYVYASQWLFRSDLIKEVGGWRSSKEIFSYPSQEWLFRVWKKKKHIQMIPKLTVVLVPAGFRKDAYANRDATEIQTLFETMQTDPCYRHYLLSKGRIDAKSHPVRDGVRSIYFNGCLKLGIPPYAIINFVRHGRRGGVIRNLRKINGLIKS